MLISFNSYGENVCFKTDGQNRDGIFYLSNDTEPFTGKNLCLYEDGQFSIKGQFKDGKPDGNWTVWHQNGQIQSEENYKDGKKDGKHTSWYVENGIKKIYSDAYYEDGECISGDC